MKIKTLILLLSIQVLNISCGVKGDPIPPGSEAYIGTGKPGSLRSRHKYPDAQSTIQSERVLDSSENSNDNHATKKKTP